MAAQLSDYELVAQKFKHLHEKANKLNLRDEDLRKLKCIKKHKDKTCNVIVICLKYLLYLFFAVAVGCLVVGGTIQFNLIDRRTAAEWTSHLTGIDLDNDDCLIPMGDVLFELLMRPATNCSFCKGIDKFERVSNLSRKSFVRDYAYSGRPVIITDATKNWSAQATFSFDFLKSVYKPDSPVFVPNSPGCQFFGYQTEFDTLGDVFKMSKERSESPWYIGWSNCDPQAANKLRQHYNRPYFLSPEMESSKTDWLFMGTPGYGAAMHIDNVYLSSWQAQIQGDKEWTLEPPPECYYKCGGRFTDTVRVGEVVVLDTNRWFHGTNVVGDEISIVIGSEYD